MQKLIKHSKLQTGIMMVALIFIIAIFSTSYLLRTFTPAVIKIERDKKTNQSLSVAKQALLAFSAEKITDIPKITPNTSMTCGLNCRRPGDLPCPDKNNDGEAETTCNTQVARLGRLPWKTLGVGDLRDGSGERLWYAVSNKYKNNTRILPLNSDSLGSISLKNNVGSVLYDATANTGLAAVVIASKNLLTRADGIVQNRSPSQELIASNYLDTAFGEDNANFVDESMNGFISGEIQANGQKISNDIALPISRIEMNAAMETRVLAEVMQAVLYRFCVNGPNFKTRTCTGSITNDFLPDPAAVNDLSCLGAANIANTACLSNASISFGRVAVGGNTDMTKSGGGWEKQDANSILRGEIQHNWFQQNGWRELIFYGVAPACTEVNKGCAGTGLLTLSGTTSPNNKQAILIASNQALTLQSRASFTNSALIVNYLEDENTTPLDNVYSKYFHDTTRNDRVISIP